MAGERVIQAYKDISLSMQANPLTFDIITTRNETAIARSIRNLIYTFPGERFFNPSLGSNVTRSLFENIDEVSASILREEIENTITNYEKRVELIAVNINPNFENNEFEVTIRYKIVGVDVPAQQLSFALQSVR
jgi:phage baseplate assembly protein W